MEIQREDRASCRVVCLSGDVDLHSSPSARDALLNSLDGKSSLLVDLSAVSYMDSSGVACLVESYQTARRQHVGFGLVAVAPPVMSVLKLARLDKVFPIYVSIDAFPAHP